MEKSARFIEILNLAAPRLDGADDKLVSLMTSITGLTAANFHRIIAIHAN